MKGRTREERASLSVDIVEKYQNFSSRFNSIRYEEMDSRFNLFDRSQAEEGTVEQYSSGLERKRAHQTSIGTL